MPLSLSLLEDLCFSNYPKKRRRKEKKEEFLEHLEKKKRIKGFSK